jgi:hypothetical protein
MHYVKQFNINGVDTKQVACIELRGKPNAATEGYVGVLGIDILSPLHEVYKCVAKNGSIYTWELLSSGTCIMSSIITGAGEELAEFPYDKLKTVANYIVKIGDVIIDKEGFLYQVDSINTTSCIARYNGTQIVSGIPKVGEVDNGKILSVVDGCHAFVGVEESSVGEYVDTNIENIKNGTTVAGKAKSLQYVLKAQGSWESSSPSSTTLNQRYIISPDNFIKPYTRYLIKTDDGIMDGFSDSTGTEIGFHHIATPHKDGVSNNGLDVVIHEGKILYREGSGLYFTGFSATFKGGLTGGITCYELNVKLTHILEGESLPF